MVLDDSQDTTSLEGVGAAQKSTVQQSWLLLTLVYQAMMTTQDEQRGRRKHCPPLNDMHRRQQEWADTYTSVDGLRQAFGTNRNKLWGDLPAPVGRLLYQNLLPWCLMELWKQLDQTTITTTPQELAPLAYQARKAAKLYVRERCTLPSRFAAILMDVVRNWKQYKTFQPHGLTYDQLWQKYAQQISKDKSEIRQDPAVLVSLKILESSCRTNPTIDRLVLWRNQTDTAPSFWNKRNPKQKEEFDSIMATLERDIRALLAPPSSSLPQQQ